MVKGVLVKLCFENGSKWVFCIPRKVCVRGSFKSQLYMEMMYYIMLKISGKLR